MRFDQTRVSSRRPPRALMETARAILEHEGRECLTLPRLADKLGVSVRSLSRYVDSDRAIERQLIIGALSELADMVEDDQDLLLVGRAYRRFAARHPRLYELMTDGPPAPSGRPSEPIDQGAP